MWQPLVHMLKTNLGGHKLFSCTAEHLHCLTLAFQSGKLSPHQSLLQNVSITVCLHVSLPVIWGSNVSSFMPLGVLFLHTSFSYPVSTCEGLLTFLVCHVVWKVIFSHFLGHAETFWQFFSFNPGRTFVEREAELWRSLGPWLWRSVLYVSKEGGINPCGPIQTHFLQE